MSKENMIKAIRKKAVMKNYPDCKTYDEAVKAECYYTIKDIVMQTYDLDIVLAALGDSFAYILDSTMAYNGIVKISDGLVQEYVCMWSTKHTLDEQLEETIQAIYNILYE